ncbi:hypothetical protein J6590_108789 [Homalodisca vitripennis]|nr:hypothetical protein J6590_108789 [Homalodisca vitripennis]
MTFSYYVLSVNGYNFKKWKENIHDEQRSGMLSLVSDNCLNKVNEKVCEDCPSQFQNFPIIFLRISQSFFNTKTVTEKLDYHKFVFFGYQYCFLITTREGLPPSEIVQNVNLIL